MLTYSVTGETLLRATDENKQLLVDLLSAQGASGGTNFEAGLVQAFDVLDNSRNSTESYSGCKTAIIFLSDGFPTWGLTDAAGLAQLVEDRNAIYDARLFSFALGPTADEVSIFGVAEPPMSKVVSTLCVYHIAPG